MLRQWEKLPDYMRVPEVRPYWEALYRKRGQLIIKRIFDISFSLILLILLAVPMMIIALLIKIDSPGPILYRQLRVTTYGKRFRIHKFRTMVSNADQTGASVTVNQDSRITRIGSKLRNTRLDEIPQVIDVICGDMSFVGTRPEVVKYVEKYKPEYNATLLMPAGITSECSIRFKDENCMMENVEDIDDFYINKVIPDKMKCNLESIKEFCIFNDMITMFRTLHAVLSKD